MTIGTRSDARGFSLVELLVAMLVTLIVSGAIYGLLAGGQSAFRREPELTDRQQQIRVAMDLIMRDIGNAGAGLPSWIQAFTRNLDACTGCPNGGAPMGLDGNVTDELEIITNTGARDNEPVCSTPGQGNSVNIRLVRTAAPISGPVVIVFEDGTWTLMNVTSTQGDSSGDGNCTAGQNHTRLNFNTGAGDTSGMNVPGGTCQPNSSGLGNAGSGTTGCPSAPGGGPCCTATQISFAEIIRYRIRNDPGGVPVLQRFTSADVLSGFQTVASGIEDLQVQYTQASGTVTTGAPGAPQVVPANYGSLTTQVQVTLASRSEARNIQGMTANASARDAIRGRLTSTGSPRSTLLALTQQSPNPIWQ